MVGLTLPINTVSFGEARPALLHTGQEAARLGPQQLIDSAADDAGPLRWG